MIYSVQHTALEIYQNSLKCLGERYGVLRTSGFYNSTAAEMVQTSEINRDVETVQVLFNSAAWTGK